MMTWPLPIQLNPTLAVRFMFVQVLYVHHCVASSGASIGGSESLFGRKLEVPEFTYFFFGKGDKEKEKSGQRRSGDVGLILGSRRMSQMQDFSFPLHVTYSIISALVQNLCFKMWLRED
jgi:hypothetical protein